MTNSANRAAQDVLGDDVVANPPADPSPSVYQMRVVLHAVSPLIWRRLLVAGDATIADLHAVLQTAFGWGGEHLHRFVIHGVEYGINYGGGPRFRDDARRVRLAALGLRVGERFVYEYNFFAGWRVDLRVEEIVAAEPRPVYPRCTAGRRAGPPEGWDGPWAFLEGKPTCFGFVQTYDTKPKRRLFEVLAAHGMQANQQVTFLTDGGEDIRDLPRMLNPQAEHLLDWFHITMRLTVMTNMAKSLRSPPPDPDLPHAPSPDRDLAAEVAGQLQSLKWLRWHGNVFRALTVIGELRFDLDIDEPDDSARKLGKAVGEFDSYIRANTERIPNYGERHRAGETISTSFVESTVNQLVSKRMVKKQQMRWTPRGAHLLLQVRARVLNDQLAEDFHRWYPAFTNTPGRHTMAA